jgi:hypothetical protein
MPGSGESGLKQVGNRTERRGVTAEGNTEPGVGSLSRRSCINLRPRQGCSLSSPLDKLSSGPVLTPATTPMSRSETIFSVTGTLTLHAVHSSCAGRTRGIAESLSDCLPKRDGFGGCAHESRKLGRSCGDPTSTTQWRKAPTICSRPSLVPCHKWAGIARRKCRSMKCFGELYKPIETRVCSTI